MKSIFVNVANAPLKCKLLLFLKIKKKIKTVSKIILYVIISGLH